MNKEFELKTENGSVSLFCESCGFYGKPLPIVSTFQDSWPEEKKKLVEEMEGHKCFLSKEEEDFLKKIALKKRELAASLNKSLKEILKEEKIKDVCVFFKNVKKDEDGYLKEADAVIDFDVKVTV